MKGQTEVMSTMLLTMITISVVGTVYLYGVPLIEKNKDVSTMQNTEEFMFLLNEKVKQVANGGGTELTFNTPGVLRFNSTDSSLSVMIRTQGTIYATGGEIELTKQSDLENDDMGSWGETTSGRITVNSQEQNGEYITTYKLDYRTLVGNECYKIDLNGDDFAIGQGTRIRLKYDDVEDVDSCGGDYSSKKLLKSKIIISII